MSAKSLAVSGFTPDQIDLIKNTVAKGATMDEFKLFLYRCRELNLDPLKPGEIFFIKFGSSPGTIVIGIEGFRKRAHRTGMYSGIKRGVTKDENGNLQTAWCEIYRKDWQHPAREEVSFREYNTQKGMWLKIPEQMLKKVAEAGALRMAFSEELGGLYSMEEMDQAKRGNPDVRMATTEAKDFHQPDDFATGRRQLKEASALASPGDFVITFGNLKGVALNQCSAEELTKWSEDLINEAVARGQEIKPDGEAAKHLNNIEAYLKELEEV